jgi:vancomycin resistance protein YoaR
MRPEPELSYPGRDRAFYEERRRAKARAARMRRFVAGGVTALVFVGVFGVGAGFAGSSARIAAGVTIDGLDVGGMTADAARRALEAHAASVADQPVVFVHGSQRFSLAPSQIGVEADWNAAISQALDKGDGFLLFRGIKRLALRIAGADITAAVSKDDAALARQVSSIASRIDQPAQNARLRLNGLTPTIVPAQTGLALDQDAAAQVVGAALASFDRGSAIQLPVRVTQPALRSAALIPLQARVRTILSGPVELQFKKRHFTVPPSTLATFLRLPTGSDTTLSFGGLAAQKYFIPLAKRIDRQPVDAGFTLDRNGRPRVVPAKEGRKLDVQASLQAALTAALVASPAGRRAELSVATAEPKRTTQEARAMGIRSVVGTYTTSYGGVPNRIHNVQLVAKLIDDHLIAPGATFSFNQTTGERNAAKGFLEAPVIINGELQTGLGGGVCQVSTTTFNAAFVAGLKIIERTNHALYISHYPQGRDATVNYPDTDLKFVNDTGHWLWLRTFVGSSEITVTLYGTPTGRKVEYETGPLTVTGPPHVKRVPDPNSYKGETWVESYGQPSRSTWVHRIVRDRNGHVLYDNTWYSSYQWEPKIVHYGTKPRPKSAPGHGSSGGASGGSGAGGSGGGTGSNGSGAGGSSGSGGSASGSGGSGSGSGGSTGGSGSGSSAPPPPPG